MKEILLDTHMLLWATLDSNKLSKKAIELIDGQENQIYFSVISLWELQLKQNIYNNVIDRSINDFTIDLIEKGFNPIPLYPRDIYNLNELKIRDETIVHKDLFDRCLLAQAKKRNMIFLTHDHAFKNYNEDVVCVV